MSYKLEAAKQRLYQRTLFAQSGRKAIGRMEDVQSSIKGEGVLKSTLEFADGFVTLRVEVEPDDVITYENGGKKTVIVGNDYEFIGIDWGSEEEYKTVEFPVDMSEVEAVMEPMDMATQEQPADHVTGEWSDDEIGTCLTMLGDGQGSADIAASLNRGLDVTKLMIKNLREEIAGDLEPDPAAAAPPPAETHHGKRAVFSEKDVARMIKLWGQGNKATRIAEIMKRKPKQVANFIQRNRDKFPTGKGLAAPMPLAEPTPQPAPTPPAAPDVDCSGWSLLERQTEVRLDNIPFVKAWSPERDLLLVETLVGGEGFDQAAAAVKRSARDCKARWNLLLPEVTIDAQAAVVTVLRSWVSRGAAQ